MQNLSESIWVRGWSDTKRGLGSWQFWVLEVFGGGLMAILVSPAMALIFVLGMAVALWIGATVSAPTRQRNELREYVQSFQERPLVIQFDPDKNVVMHESKVAGTFRVEVQNTGPKTVEGVGIQIVGMVGETDEITRSCERFIGLRLAATSDPTREFRKRIEKPRDEVTLPPEGAQIFDLARLTKRGSCFTICHAHYERRLDAARQETMGGSPISQVPGAVIPSGRLEVVLRAFGQDTMSDEKRFIAEVTDKTVSLEEV